MPPTFGETDLGRLVRQVAAGFDADRPVEVRAEPVVAEVDGPKIERVVENLISNAVKHTPPGTKIEVWVEPSDGGALIGVDDRGGGVAADEREAIFEAFTRSSLAATAGTGIGLALVAQFTALHGGRAWVEEGCNGGASFRVFLPSRQT